MWCLFLGIIFLILGITGLIVNKNTDKPAFSRPTLIDFQGFYDICIIIGLFLVNQQLKLLPALVIK